MKKIREITGKAFHLPGDNIDTDRIIPKDRLKCSTFEGLAPFVFEGNRKQMAGNHPFDRPENKGANILITGSNFGCGSSREHAPQALIGWGIKGFIGKSSDSIPAFADIFRGNCTANATPCVELNEEDHKALLQFEFVAPTVEVCIDLEKMEVIFSNSMDKRSWKCTMPSAHRDMLLDGTWDRVMPLLEAGDLIEKTASRLPYMQTA